MLAREGMSAVVEGAKIMAIAVIRSVEAVLFLRESYMLARDEFVRFVDDMGDFAQRVPAAPFQILGRIINDMDLEVTDPATVSADIARMREISGNLEVLVGQIDNIGGASSRARRIANDLAGSVDGLMGSMFDLSDTELDIDDDGARSFASAIDTATIAVDGLGVGLYGMAEAHQAAMGFAEKHGRALSAQVEAMKAHSQAAQEIANINKELYAPDRNAMKLDATADIEAMAELEASAMSVADVTSTAMGSIRNSLSGLSLAAFWKKDGDAMKEFGKALGKMLLQVGTMAVSYAAIAALGTAFPALAPLLGNPVAAPGLALAGAGAIAAGAVLGAAIPRGGGGGAVPAQEQAAGPTTTTNVYQVSFDSLTPARARNRAMVESLGSSVESGA
jgi:hypothetical protein